MNKLLSPEKFAALLQAIDDEPTGKLSELARVARLNLAEDYIGADLSGEDLSEDDLQGINLSRADLSGANLSRSDLSGANLRGANLRGAVLKDADLTNADLSGADLTHADLTNTILIGTLLDTKPLNPREQLPTAGLENGAFHWLFLHPTVCEDFCLMLRNWHEKAKTRQIWQRLRLLVAHATEEYIKLPDHHSPFNVGVPIELPEFTVEQVQALAKHSGLKEDSIQISQLIDLVGGHPYLVNLAFSHLKAHPDVTLAQLLTVAPTEQGIYSSHLRELLDILRQNPDLRVAFKAVATAGEPVCLETLIGHKLRSMGLIKWRKDQALPSCQLYRRYFSDRL